jgi:putative acetyltransferase
MNAKHSAEVIVAGSAGELDRVRVLLGEYQQAVGAPICFAAFAEELRRLPGVYAEPRGCLLLAGAGGADAGCVGLRPVEGEAGAVELKRLYVRPQFRRAGIGRTLVQRAIDHACGQDYRRILLDTLETMQAAQRLYLSLGFRFIPIPEGQSRDHPLLMELLL